VSRDAHNISFISAKSISRHNLLQNNFTMTSTTRTSVLALPPSTLEQNLRHGNLVHDDEEFDVDSLLYSLDEFFPDILLLDSHLTNSTDLSSPPIPNKSFSSAPIIHIESKFVPIAPQPFTLFTTPELLEPSQLSEILATTTTTLPSCVSPSPSLRSLDKPEKVVSDATPASALTKRLLATAIQPTLPNKKRRVNSCSSSSLLKDSLGEEEKKRR
jgi:hypothetical protein